MLSGACVGEGLALQADGKLVLVGNVDAIASPATATQFAVMRLSADGSPDSTFGAAGLVKTAFSTIGDVAHAVALQNDGRIVVAGTSSGPLNANFALARYNVDGSLDTSFLGGGDGRTTVDFFSSTDGAENVAVQSDGKMVLGGFARNNVDGYALARFKP